MHFLPFLLAPPPLWAVGILMTTSSTTSFQWPPLESSPEIFDQYMSSLGLPMSKWGFTELFGFDEEMIQAQLRDSEKAVAVIVNFEPVDPIQERQRGIYNQDNGNNVVDYYMKQTEILDNACGLIACLHSIYNSPKMLTSLDPQSLLSKYYQTIRNKRPLERAHALEDYKEFQQIHQQFAQKGQSDMPTTQNDVHYHYVAYILNSNKQLVELNGTRQGPHLIVCDDDRVHTDDVVRATTNYLQQRLANKEITEALSVLVLHSR